nr:50S ribosomal protein L5P [uncultured archaeon]
MTTNNNTMRNIRVEKVTLNVGAGKDQARLEKGVALLKYLTGIPPVKTVTQKRIPTWGLRPGLPIGCKITLRGSHAVEFLKKALTAKEGVLSPSNFDNSGTVSFGIPEYIDIEGMKYSPEIGTFGFELCVTLTRPGFRVKKRRVKSSPLGKSHLISKADAMKFLVENFKVRVGDVEAVVV